VVDFNHPGKTPHFASTFFYSHETSSQLPLSLRVSLSEGFPGKCETGIEIGRKRIRKTIMKIAKIILQGMVLAALSIPVATFANDYDPTINQRKENQQDRIAQGVRSGQLTAGETGHLEGQEAAFNREERGMRAADGGHLTGGDRAVLNHQQNRMSREIYNKKHNGRVQ
jgi:hypothetical protein